MSSIEDVQLELAKEFAVLAELRGQALRDSNSKKANSYFDKLVALVKKADASEHGRTCFTPLLASENIDVRVVAASTVISLATSKAVPVLEAAAAERKGAASMTAYMVLTQWREGTFRFP